MMNNSLSLEEKEVLFELIAQNALGREIPVHCFENGAFDGAIAFTGAEGIFICIGHKLYKIAPDNEQIIIEIGNDAHEVLHQLLTPMERFNGYVKDEAVRRSVPPSCLHSFMNIGEDGFIEHYADMFFGGLALKGLELGNYYLTQSAEDIAEAGSAYQQVLVAYNQYEVGGKVKGTFTFPEAAEAFKSLVHLYAEILEATNDNKRERLFGLTFDVVEPLIKAEVKAAEEAAKKFEEEMKNHSQSSSNGTGHNAKKAKRPENSEASDKEKLQEMIRQALESATDDSKESEGKEGEEANDSSEDSDSETSDSQGSTNDSSNENGSDSEGEESDANSKSGEGSESEEGSKDGSQSNGSGSEPKTSEDGSDNQNSESEEGTGNSAKSQVGTSGESQKGGKSSGKEGAGNSSFGGKNGEKSSKTSGKGNLMEVLNQALEEAKNSETAKKAEENPIQDDLGEIDSAIQSALHNMERAAKAKVKRRHEQEHRSDVNTELSPINRENMKDVQMVSPTASPYHTMMYNETLSEHRVDIQTLARKIQTMIKEDRAGKTYANSGKISVKRLASPKMRLNVFEKRKEAVGIDDTSVVLMLDASGSTCDSTGMGRLLSDEIADTAIGIVEALNECNVPCAVMGFTSTDPRVESLKIKHINYCGFKSTKADRASIKSHHPECYNCDSVAVLTAKEALKKRRSKHKILLVLSDGTPTLPMEEGYGADGTRSKEELIQAVRETKNDGIIFGGLAFTRRGYSTADELHQFYGDAFDVVDPWDGDNGIQIAGNLLEDIIKRQIR